jgi:hypothetical protein
MSATAITIKCLLGIGGVTAIVGTRIYPTIIEAEKDLPAIAVRLSGQGEAYNLSGADHYPTSTVTVTCIGKDPAETDRLGEAVEAALKDFRGAVTTSVKTYSAIFMKDPSDGAFYEDLVENYRRSSDYRLRWR